jgi:hypothetical protein
VFDLVALGWLVSAKAPVAAREIEIVCDATHLNATADLHSSFDNLPEGKPPVVDVPAASSLRWLALNPVDLFRAVNLSRQLGIDVPARTTLLAVSLWLAGTLGISLWKLQRIDL